VTNGKLRDIYGTIVSFVDIISIANWAGNIILTGLIFLTVNSADSDVKTINVR
jgi:hypothetical protein